MIFCLGWGHGQEVFFNHLNRNDSSGTIYSAFSNFFGWAPCSVDIGLFHKKTKQWRVGGLRKYFFEPPAPPEIFHFFTLPLETPQNCVRYLGNSKAKNQEPCPGNSALFFLGHPRGRQFHFIFS